MKQVPLFDDDALGPTPPAPSNPAKALAVQPQMQQPTTPAQRAFQNALLRVQRGKERIAALIELTDHYRVRFHQELEPYTQEMCDAIWSFVLRMHADLERDSKLNKTQRGTAIDTMVIALMTLSQHRFNDEIEALATHYNKLMESMIQDSESGFDHPCEPIDLNQSVMDEIKMTLGKMAGIDMSSVNTAEELDAMLRHLMGNMAPPAKKNARKSRKQLAREQRDEAERVDAEEQLRVIYRELTRALHPDRETDPAEQRRKTDLMGTVNAAYARRDLMALLEMQLQIEQVSADKIREMTDTRLVALTRVLKEQIPVLEQEWQKVAGRFLGSFDVEYSGPMTAPGLERLLFELKQQILQTRDTYTSDLADIKRGSTALRRWLNREGKRIQGLV